MTKEKAYEYFLLSLCNAAEFLAETSEVHIRPDDRKHYREWKGSLAEETKKLCYEDLYVMYLKDGHKLVMEDTFDDGKVIGELTDSTISKKSNSVPKEVIGVFVEENDDAVTASMYLQYLMLGEYAYS
jgi:hypothetical protein